jgi:hypothetical protein
MNFEQIDALTIEQTFSTLINRILDLSVVPNGEPVYQLDQDDSLPFYDRVIMNQALVKPPLSNIQAELVEYQNELRVVEQARLDEIARVEAIKVRWNAISDVRGALSEAGISDVPNTAIELKRIIDENDEARLSLLESSAAAWDVKVAAQAVKNSRKNAGKAARKVCEDVIDLIAGFNLERSLTTEQITQMQSTFADANALLKNNQPWGAKAAIEAITPDGTLVTQEMKDAALAEFAESGLAGL